MKQSDRAQVPCKGLTDLFFPTEHVSYNEAAEICARCPVAQVCLDDEMAYEGKMGMDMRHGMYGGLTPAQRYELARDTASA